MTAIADGKRNLAIERYDRFSSLYVSVLNIGFGCVCYFMVGVLVVLIYVFSETDYLLLSGIFRDQRFFSDDGYYLSKQVALFYGLLGFLASLVLGPIGATSCVAWSWMLSLLYVVVCGFVYLFGFQEYDRFLMRCLSVMSLISHILFCNFLFFLLNPVVFGDAGHVSYRVLSFATGFLCGSPLVSFVLLRLSVCASSAFGRKDPANSVFDLGRILLTSFSVALLSTLCLTFQFVYDYFVLSYRNAQMIWTPLFSVSASVLNKSIVLLDIQLVIGWLTNPVLVTLIPYTTALHFQFHRLTFSHKILYSLLILIITLITFSGSNDSDHSYGQPQGTRIRLGIMNVMFSDGFLQIQDSKLYTSPISTTSYPNHLSIRLYMGSLTPGEGKQCDSQGPSTGIDGGMLTRLLGGIYDNNNTYDLFTDILDYNKNLINSDNTHTTHNITKNYIRHYLDFETNVLTIHIPNSASFSPVIQYPYMDDSWDHAENEDKHLISQAASLIPLKTNYLSTNRITSNDDKRCLINTYSSSSLIRGYNDQFFSIIINNSNILSQTTINSILSYDQVSLLIKCLYCLFCIVCDESKSPSQCTCTCDCTKCSGNTICLCLCNSTQDQTSNGFCLCVCKKNDSCKCICICVCKKNGSTCNCGTSGKHTCEKCLVKIDLSSLNYEIDKIKDELCCVLCYMSRLLNKTCSDSKKCCCCICCVNGKCGPNTCNQTCCCKDSKINYLLIILRMHWIEHVFIKIFQKIHEKNELKKVLSCYSAILTKFDKCLQNCCDDKGACLIKDIQEAVTSCSSCISTIGEIKILADYKTFCSESKQISCSLESSVNLLSTRVKETNRNIVCKDVFIITSKGIVVDYKVITYELSKYLYMSWDILNVLSAGTICCCCICCFKYNIKCKKIEFTEYHNTATYHFQTYIRWMSENHGNTLCLCLITNYVLIPNVKTLLHYISDIVGGLCSSVGRRFDGYTYSTAHLMSVGKLIMMLISVIYRITQWMKNNYLCRCSKGCPCCCKPKGDTCTCDCGLCIQPQTKCCCCPKEMSKCPNSQNNGSEQNNNCSCKCKNNQGQSCCGGCQQKCQGDKCCRCCCNCFCKSYNDRYYPYIVSTILYLSSIIENIWATDNRSIVTAIQCLSNLYSELKSYDFSSINDKRAVSCSKICGLITNKECQKDAKKCCWCVASCNLLLACLSLCVQCRLCKALCNNSETLCNKLEKFCKIDQSECKCTCQCAEPKKGLCCLLNSSGCSQLPNSSTSNCCEELKKILEECCKECQSQNGCCKKILDELKTKKVELLLIGCCCCTNVASGTSNTCSCECTSEGTQVKTWCALFEALCGTRSIGVVIVCKCQDPSKCCCLPGAIKKLKEKLGDLCQNDKCICQELKTKVQEICNNSCGNQECPCNGLKTKLTQICGNGGDCLCTKIDALKNLCSSKPGCKCKEAGGGCCRCVCCKLLVGGVRVLTRACRQNFLEPYKRIIIELLSGNKDKQVIRSIVNSINNRNVSITSLVKNNYSTHFNTYTDHKNIANSFPSLTVGYAYDTVYEHQISGGSYPIIKGFARGGPDNRNPSHHTTSRTRGTVGGFGRVGRTKKFKIITTRLLVSVLIVFMFIFLRERFHHTSANVDRLGLTHSRDLGSNGFDNYFGSEYSPHIGDSTDSGEVRQPPTPDSPGAGSGNEGTGNPAKSGEVDNYSVARSDNYLVNLFLHKIDHHEPFVNTSGGGAGNWLTGDNQGLAGTAGSNWVTATRNTSGFGRTKSGGGRGTSGFRTGGGRHGFTSRLINVRGIRRGIWMLRSQWKKYAEILVYTLVCTFYVNMLVNEIGMQHMDHEMWSFMLSIGVALALLASLVCKYWVHLYDFMHVLEAYGRKLSKVHCVIDPEEIGAIFQSIGERVESKYVMMYSLMRTMGKDVLGFFTLSFSKKDKTTYNEMKRDLYPYKDMSEAIVRMTKSVNEHEENLGRIRDTVVESLGITGETIDVYNVLDFLSYILMCKAFGYLDQYRSYFYGNERYASWRLGRPLNENFFLITYYRYSAIFEIDKQIQVMKLAGKQTATRNCMLLWQVFGEMEIQLITLKSMTEENLSVPMTDVQKDVLKARFNDYYLLEFLKFQLYIMASVFNVREQVRPRTADIESSFPFADVFEEQALERDRVRELCDKYFESNYKAIMSSMTLPMRTCDVTGHHDEVWRRVKAFAEYWLEFRYDYCKRIRSFGCEKAINFAFDLLMSTIEKPGTAWDNVTELLRKVNLENIDYIKQMMEGHEAIVRKYNLKLYTLTLDRYRGPISQSYEAEVLHYLNEYTTGTMLNKDKVAYPLGIYMSWYGVPVTEQHLRDMSKYKFML